MKKHIHPYHEEFGQSAKFKYEFQALHADISNPQNFSVDWEYPRDNPLTRRIKRSIKEFKLTEVYHVHRDVLGEVVSKTKQQSKYYILDVLKKAPKPSSQLCGNLSILYLEIITRKLII